MNPSKNPQNNELPTNPWEKSSDLFPRNLEEKKEQKKEEIQGKTQKLKIETEILQKIQSKFSQQKDTYLPVFYRLLSRSESLAFGQLENLLNRKLTDPEKNSLRSAEAEEDQKKKEDTLPPLPDLTANFSQESQGFTTEFSQTPVSSVSSESPIDTTSQGSTPMEYFHADTIIHEENVRKEEQKPEKIIQEIEKKEEKVNTEHAETVKSFQSFPESIVPDEISFIDPAEDMKAEQARLQEEKEAKAKEEAERKSREEAEVKAQAEAEAKEKAEAEEAQKKAEAEKAAQEALNESITSILDLPDFSALEEKLQNTDDVLKALKTPKTWQEKNQKLMTLLFGEEKVSSLTEENITTIVSRIQTLMNEEGSFSLETDGKFGNQSFKAFESLVTYPAWMLGKDRKAYFNKPVL